MRKFIFILLSIVLWSISAKAIAQSGDNSGIISNHEIAAADLRIRDPFILADTKTKTYYLYRQIANGRGDSTEGVRGVEVYESQNLEIWKGPKVVYQQPANFWANAQVWAPEVHLYKGKYYLFVTFSANQSINGSNGQWLPIRGTQILVSDKAVGPLKALWNHRLFESTHDRKSSRAYCLQPIMYRQVTTSRTVYELCFQKLLLHGQGSSEICRDFSED